MANRTRAKKGAKSSGSKATGKSMKVFTDEERSAMKERAREMKAGDAGGEKAVLAKIAEMSGADRAMGERVHAIVRANAPSLTPKLWYGMPAYARDGKVVCFFQPGLKFKARYATLGFSDLASLDEGAMWPTSYALTKLSAADEKMIGELVKRAAR